MGGSTRPAVPIFEREEGGPDIVGDQPLHSFDEARAAEYRPRLGFVKTAILVQLADEQAEVTVETPFGRQTVNGAFYVVAEEGASYCASRAEFEATHEEVSPNTWVKRSAVQAYVADVPSRVETWLADGTHEASVDAEPGDWIVRQQTGEVMVVGDDEFTERYEPVN